MFFLTLVLRLALVASAIAYPSLQVQIIKPPSGKAPASAPWAQTGIARSPCPALNALANMNILPHNGRNYTGPQVSAAIETYLNFDSTILTDFGFLSAWASQCAILTNATTPCTHYDLDMLNIPHAAEHDGSLSRADYDAGLGNNYAFNPTIWREVTEMWNLYDLTNVNISMAQTARVLRQTCANETDVPGWFLPETEQSLGETAFYLAVFSDPEVEGTAKREWVEWFFESERLPVHLGWSAGQRKLIQAPALLGMIADLAAADVLPF